MKPERVLQADTETLALEGLRYLIRTTSDVPFLPPIKNFEDLINEIRDHPNTLVMADPFNLGMDKKQIVDLIKCAKNCHCQLAFITKHTRLCCNAEIIDMGLDACIDKGQDEESIKEAIRRVLEGNTYYSHTQRGKSASANQDEDDLTDREHEILILIARGYSSLEIADNLCLSNHTVNSYRKSLVRKLKARTQAELIIQAIRMGWIHL
ncbi:MAG: response regulator transcription factor [Cyclobacteriaceae bacterium]|nr:response regulator transcription factor [Cyclobacteriaceae bacterium]